MKHSASFEALAEARHPDPFGVLGPHVEPGGVVIRAIVPTAESITITRNGSRPVGMVRRHPSGIFEATLSGATEIPEYRRRVT